MMHWEWIVTAAAVIGVYVLYVSLIKKKNNLKEAAAGIDVQLKSATTLFPICCKRRPNLWSMKKD